MGQSLAFISGKGGVGKSACALQLGLALAAQGSEVLLCDCDFGMRNLDILMGLDDRVVYHVGDCLQGLPADRAVVQSEQMPRLRLLAAPPLWQQGSLELSQVPALHDALCNAYDFVLFDGPAGLSDGFSCAVCAADRVVLVSELADCSLRCADGAAEEALTLGAQRLSLLLNRLSPKRLKKAPHPNADDAVELLGIGLLGIVPQDDRFFSEFSPQQPYQAGGPAREAFARIARRLRGEAVALPKESRLF